MNRSPAARQFLLVTAIFVGCCCVPKFCWAQADADEAKELQAKRNALFVQAGKLKVAGKFDEAIPLAQEVVKIDEQRYGKLNTTVLNSLRYLGLLHKSAKHLEEADTILREVAKRFDSLHDESNPEYINTLSDLGNLQRDLDRIERSESFHRRAYSLAIKSGRRDSVQASAATGMGLYFFAIGEPRRALPLLVEAREIMIEAGLQKQKRSQYVRLLNSLGAIYGSLQQLERSRAMFEEALALLRGTVGENHIDYLLSLKNQGVSYLQAGDLENATLTLQQGLRINERLAGVNGISNADYLNDLGQVALRKGDFKGAETLFRRARQLLASKPEVVQTQRAIHGLVTSQGATGRFAAAFELQTEIMEFQQKPIGKILSVGAENGMSEYLQSITASIEVLCMLAGQVQQADHLAAETALTWTLRRKGIIAETLCHFREQENTISQDPSVRPMVNQLRNLRSQLAEAALNPDKADDPGFREQKDRWESEADRLERQVHRKISAYRSQQTQPFHTVEASSLRKKLPAEGVLIECLCTRIRNFKAFGQESNWGPDHYFAFILHPEQDSQVQLVDLGEANVIDKAIKTFRTKFEETPRELRGSDEKTVEEDFRKVSNELYELIFAPLRQHLGKATLIYLAPDGQLSQIPFEALADKEEKYLLESYRFAYLVTGRDLLQARLKPATNGPIAGRSPVSGPGTRRNGPVPPGPRGPARRNNPNPSAPVPGRPSMPGGDNRIVAGRGTVVFAGPDFDLKASDRQTQVNALLGNGRPSNNLVAVRGFTASDTRSLHWQPLAGAAAEAEDIRKALSGKGYGPLKTYVGPEALEEVFKTIAPPRILHIATHGFFLPDKKPASPAAEPQPAQENPAEGGEEGRGGMALARLRQMRDPMRRSGIVLAGANAVDEPGAAGMEDGWVTAEEISLMDLHGTEMVVLSACETGLGDVRLGEGVFGLRRAFLNAGARTLVTSLFEVPDAETRALMRHFYGELANGANKLDALHAAKVALRRERLEKNEAAHPFFWASFILIGDPKLAVTRTEGS